MERFIPAETCIKETMHKNHYLEMYEKEKENWWFQGKRLVVHSLINKFVSRYQSVLDVGCGTGILLKEFLSKGKKVYGTDVSSEAIQFSKKRGLDNVRNIDFSKEGFEDKRFDLVLCLDVLEHIDDDKRTLLNIKQNMYEDSHLLLRFLPFNSFGGQMMSLLGIKEDIPKNRLNNFLKNVILGLLKAAILIFLFFLWCSG